MDTSALESLSIFDLFSAVIEICTTTVWGQVLLGLVIGSFIARLVASWFRLL